MIAQKKLQLGTIGILLIFILGCVSPPTQPPTNPPTNPPSSVSWLYFSPVQAHTNPWEVADIDFITAPTQEQLVQAWLSSIAISASRIVFVPHDEVVCTALNCPRGDYLLVLPSTPLAQSELIEEGFAPMKEPFFYAQTSANNVVTFTLVNASAEKIFYGGCNDYTIRKNSSTGESVLLPGKTCIWEGIPNVLESGKSITFYETISANGNYEGVLGYGVGCASEKPISEAACSSEHTLKTNTFTIQNVMNASTISAVYGLKQCNSNPWQTDTNALILTEDKVAFTNWLEENGITPKHVSYTPAPEGLAVCLACSCASGETYRIIISADEQIAAEGLGFVTEGAYAWPEETPNFAAAEWRIVTPYQCFANKWNTEHVSVRNVEKDFELLKKWLEEQGVNVTYLAHVRGVTLSQQCTKLSTDKYGIGVLSQEDVDLLSSLGFIAAGPQQTKLFTDTENTEERQYLYKTKFCQTPPWGTPDLSSGNEAEVVERVHAWLTEMGIPAYEKPTIHSVGVSPTGSCGTDSGLSVFITIAAWGEVHILPYGFAKPSYAFNPAESQVYPVNSSPAGGTMIAGGETCEGDACAYT